MDTSRLFADKPSGYAAHRPLYPDRLFEFLSDLCPSKDRALDVATGNGQAAIGLARHFKNVSATDISPEQVAHAFPAPNVEYSVQAAEESNFPDRTFDLVSAAQSLHWFDFDRFWPEVHRLLRPKGVFAAYSYNKPTVNAELDAELKERVGNVIREYWPARTRLASDEYRDVEFPFERIQMPPMEIEVDWDIDEMFDYLGTWSATKACIKERGDSWFWEAKDAVRQVWGERRLVRMPLVMLVGRISG